MISFHLITPDGPVFEGEVDSVTLPTAAGEITVLPHHIPLMGVLLPGTVMVRMGKEQRFFAVSRGVVEVSPEGVQVLADTADRADALEEAAIERAKQAAENLVREKRHDVEGFAEATAILERELARLKTVRRHRAGRSSTPRMEE